MELTTDLSDLSRLLTLWHQRVTQRHGEAEADRDEEGVELAALKANAALVQYLTSTRWAVILQALEAGVDWDELGAALGVSRGEVWRTFCRQTDQLSPGTSEAARASTTKDPLRGRRLT